MWILYCLLLKYSCLAPFFINISMLVKFFETSLSCFLMAFLISLWLGLFFLATFRYSFFPV